MGTIQVTSKGVEGGLVGSEAWKHLGRTNINGYVISGYIIAGIILLMATVGLVDGIQKRKKSEAIAAVVLVVLASFLIFVSVVLSRNSGNPGLQNMMAFRT